MGSNFKVWLFLCCHFCLRKGDGGGGDLGKKY